MSVNQIRPTLDEVAQERLRQVDKVAHDIRERINHILPEIQTLIVDGTTDLVIVRKIRRKTLVRAQRRRA